MGGSSRITIRMSIPVSEKPRIGVSSCVFGQKVRYDGQHARDEFVQKTLHRFVEWVPVCPEVDIGMGVPREPVRLRGTQAVPRMVGQQSGTDWTDRMSAYAQQRVGQLEQQQIHGYIVKAKSPSCGMERVRVYGRGNGVHSVRGRGLFTRALMEASPCLPVEEDGRLHDMQLRENFITRVFAYQRWRALVSTRPTIARLVAFHARHKLLLLAHHEPSMRRLGRMVAEAKQHPISHVLDTYGHLFMDALGQHATSKTHANVLQHMLGHVSEYIDSETRQSVAQTISDFRRGYAPLLAPLVLIHHYVKRFHVAYLLDQVYLQPHPKELMLRNHA
jgi:uncharacterized protein YbgA (DUF1722 family)/uncharacterized protein YbbK (DUF523 family)